MPNPLQGMTFKRTVIVGLGSTGLDVLHAFQNYWFERFNNTDTSLVKLINIETAQANKVEVKSTGTMISQIFIRNRGMEYYDLAAQLQGMVNPLPQARNIPWDWRWTDHIDWRRNIGTLSDDGAGGIRAGGRILLYSPNKSNEPNAMGFYRQVRHTITNDFKPIEAVNSEVAKDIFQKLRFNLSEWVEPDSTSPDPNDNQIEKSIYNPHFEGNRVDAVVVGSLTGGTSSGMFIDIGYILQAAMGIPPTDLKRLIGVFIIPPYDEHLLAQGGKIAWDQVRSNSFGSLYDITRMKSEFSDVGNVSIMPYGYVYTVAPEYNTDETSDFFRQLNGLTEMVALRLFTNILGFKYKADTHITDEFIQNPRNYMFTMGTGAILYPKYTLIEMGGCELARNFCDVLVDEKKVFDANGQTLRINEAMIRNQTSQNLDILSKKYIYDELKSNPENDDRSVADIIENDYLKKLPEDIELHKKRLYREFIDADGYFLNALKSNKEKMIKGVIENIEGELTRDLKSYTNLTYLGLKTTFYIDEFNRLKKLWRLQDCDKFDAKGEITEMLREYNRYGKSTAPTDLDKILKDLLYNLYNKFLISRAYIYIDEIVVKLSEWNTSIKKAISTLRNSRENFHERFLAHSENLKNDFQIAPVVKLFHKGQDEDYKKIKEDVVGSKTTPDWKNFKEGPEFVEPVSFWAQIKKETVNAEPFKNNLSRQLSQKLNAYLSNEGFSILDKAQDPRNRRVVSTIFAKVNTGFLKMKPEGLATIGRIPEFIISKGDRDQLTAFVENYPLLRQNECSPFPNPIMEHMIIYTKDISNIKFENLQAYEKMKHSFLTEHAEQPDWTKLRLAYTNDVDFTIIENKIYMDIKVICEFLKYFWFNEIKQPKSIQYTPTNSAGIDYVEAVRDPAGKITSPGIYCDAHGEPHICIIQTVSRHVVDINLVQLPQHVLNNLCKDKTLYEALTSFIRPYLKFNNDEYLKNLYLHYEKSIHPNLDEQSVQSTFNAIFSEMFPQIYEERKNQGKNIVIADIRPYNCMISKLYKILFE